MKDRGRTADVPKRAAKARRTDQRLASIWFVAVLTFISGCAALIFQVAWMRELRLVFGATTASVAAVLAIFMAGLGLGSAILGKRADRSVNPLSMYGALEWGIALSVAISPWLIDFARATYITLGGQESLGISGATIVRLALAAAVMALPTFLMGGTLPAAVRSVTASNDDNRRALALIYGANTLGAVFGAAVATFYALENLGTRATLWTGCIIGLCAANAAIYRARGLRPLKKEQTTTDGEPTLGSSLSSADEESRAAHRPRLIYLTAALLGFAFFALELVWYRMLGPILGGTTFTFGLILCVALLGIGVGGLAYSFIFRRREPSWSVLAVTCALEALLTIIPYTLGDRLALVAGWWGQTANGFSSLVACWTYITCIVVLPVAIISGVQFPLLIALLGQGRQAISRQLGMAYAWNTLGAIAGSMVGGFGGLPLLSAPGMWLAIAMLLAALSGLILLATRQADRRAGAYVAGLIILTISSIFARGPTSVWRHSGIGARRANMPPISRPNDLQRWLNESRHLIFWDTDGIESSVAIHCTDGLGFIVNGKNDGNAFSDAPTQIGMPLLGVMLHKNPKTALVIGLGTGESAGWLAKLRNIEHVDLVELEPAIDEMASRCSEINGDVLHNPHVRRIYNDGREFVFTTKNKYDLIISEPSNPYRAGIASLYTAEFYRAAKNCLNPGGIFVQWLQSYETTESTIGTILSTVNTQFPHIEIWQTLPLDLQLVCSSSPLEYTVPELKERLKSRNVRDAMVKAWMIDDVEGFLTHFVASSAWAKAMAELGVFPLNTDDRTVVEFGFAKSLGRVGLFSIEKARGYMRDGGYHRPLFKDDSINWDRVEVRRQSFSALLGGGALIDLISDKTDQELIRAIFDCRAGNYASAADRWPAKYRQPTDKFQRLMLARCYAELARPEFPDLIAKVVESHPTEAAALQAVYHARKSEWSAAAKSLNDLFSRLAKNPWVIAEIADSAITQSAVIAQGAPADAKQIYENLSKPFASLRCNYQRQVFRIFVGEQLGPEYVVEALKEMEPNAVWIPEALELRAKSYAAVHHPLAARAQRDWEWYRSHQTPDDKK